MKVLMNDCQDGISLDAMIEFVRWLDPKELIGAELFEQMIAIKNGWADDPRWDI